MTPHPQPRRPRGYTFAEVLVASALLGMLIGGAVSLVATMQLQERAAHSGTVSLNLQNNAATLWQLGLSTTEVFTILPTITNNEFLDGSLVTSSGNPVAFGTQANTTLANGMGTLETITCTVTLRDPRASINRSSTMQVHRAVSR